MSSLSYLINMHGALILVATGGTLAFILLGVTVAYALFEEKRNLPANRAGVWFFAVIFVCLVAVFGAVSVLRSAYDMGGIRRVFVVAADGRPRLAVWCTRIYGKRIGADYAQYIRTYDLTTGECRGSVTAAEKNASDDFRLYRSGKNTAWGYGRIDGLRLIDLAVPQVIADYERLLQRNPILASGFKVEDAIGEGDALQRGLYVRSAGRRLYQIKDDLSMLEVNRIPVDADGRRERSLKENWHFLPVEGTKGMHVLAEGSHLAADRGAFLLEPEFISELGDPVGADRHHARIWVTHKSALLGEYALLLSYVNSDGTTLKTINVSELVPGEALNIIGTVCSGGEILILVGAGHSSRITILGFSLSVLHTDARTGDLIRMQTLF